MLTVEEAAAVLSVSTRTVWRMIDDGRLPMIKIGKAVRLPESGLLALGLTEKDIELALTRMRRARTEKV